MCSFHLDAILLCPLYRLITGEHLPFSRVLTLPHVHCRRPSCRFCLRLSAAFYLRFSPFWLSTEEFWSSLQKVVDSMLLVCITLWYDWSLPLIKLCNSSSLGSNQSWCFLSGLPRDAFSCVVRDLLYDCLFIVWCWTFSLFSLGQNALHIMFEAFAIHCWAWLFLPLVCCDFVVIRMTPLTWWSLHRKARVPRMSSLSRNGVMMQSIICQCVERICIQVILRSS